MLWTSKQTLIGLERIWSDVQPSKIPFLDDRNCSIDWITGLWRGQLSLKPNDWRIGGWNFNLTAVVNDSGKGSRGGPRCEARLRAQSTLSVVSSRPKSTRGCVNFFLQNSLRGRVNFFWQCQGLCPYFWQKVNKRFCPLFLKNSRYPVLVVSTSTVGWGRVII